MSKINKKIIVSIFVVTLVLYIILLNGCLKKHVIASDEQKENESINITEVVESDKVKEVELGNQVSEVESFDNSINVRAYGAKGDGITDDYQAIVDAIEAAGKENKKIFFPQGEYFSRKSINITEDITIEGEDKENTRIHFRDCTEHNRGLITFSGNVLNIANISVSYWADEKTDYNAQALGEGADRNAGEGVLLLILAGNNCVIQKCEFVVGGEKMPSITPIWIKAETKDISNVLLDECVIENVSGSSVGGCLWVSCVDDDKCSIQNIEVKNCDMLKTGNDEILSFWGIGTIRNVNVESNVFKYEGNKFPNYSFIAIGLDNKKGNYEKILFNNNSINVVGDVGMIIKCDEGTVEFNNNVITGEVQGETNTICYYFNNAKAVMKDNVIDIVSKGNVAHCAYQGGAVEIIGDDVKVEGNNFSYIQSVLSKYFKNANLCMKSNKYKIVVKNENKYIPNIQYPNSGILQFVNNTIDTTGSVNHEIVLQAFNGNNKDKGKIEIIGNTTDCDIKFFMMEDEKKEIFLNDNVMKNVYLNYNILDENYINDEQAVLID